MSRVAMMLLLFWQASPRVAPEPQHFRYERAVEAPAAGRACAVLDGETYAHAQPALADVRLFAVATEVPYALTMSETAPSGDAARVLNLGQRGGHIAFDLEMPSRPYSSVDLSLSGQDYLATAKVTGADKPGARGTYLGSFTLFDLAGQRLGSSTSLPLAESSFPYLHVDLAVAAAPGGGDFKPSPAMVTGAEVPPSREAQTVYTPVAETTSVTQKDGRSIATFELPAHVPVERVSFTIQPGDKTNFSRAVQVTARAESAAGQTFDERLGGTISRVRITEGGKEIRQESLEVPATLGSDGQAAAKVEVAVDNGDDKPLAIGAVRLEMRERKLCFDAPGQPVTMYYGDAKLASPNYDYSRLFQPTDLAALAQVGPETANAGFLARAEQQRTLTERHPEILWVALLAVVSVLGVVAFRTAKRVGT